MYNAGGGAHVSPLDRLEVDHDARAEVRRHRAARVLGDEHQALAGGQTGGAVAQHAAHADRGEVALIALTERVGTHRADKGRTVSQRGEPGSSVGGRSAGDLDPGRHELEDPRDLLAVDKGHRLRLDARCGNGRCIHVREPVDDGMADAHNLGRPTAERLARAIRGNVRRSGLRHESLTVAGAEPWPTNLRCS